MSTMVLETKTIEKLGNSYLLLKKVGINVSLESLENTLKTLYNLNIKSYNIAYPNSAISLEEEETYYNINFRSREKFNNDCEYLKAFQCLYYNIDSSYKKYNLTDNRAIDFIEKVISKIKDYIISNLEDYKLASWG